MTSVEESPGTFSIQISNKGLKYLVDTDMEEAISKIFDLLVKEIHHYEPKKP